jgi:putative DNA primase/helicase
VNIQQTKEAARGKWRGILISMGVGEAHLHKKHGPCPLCGGKDRFRFDNQGGDGTWFCSSCGAGDGFHLAQKATGKGFMDVVREVAEIVGTAEMPIDAIPKERTDDDVKAANRKIWVATQKMEAGNLADVYLRRRGVGQQSYVKDLRFAASLWDGDGGQRPCMVALVRDPDGNPTSLHRTFLAKDGSDKAEMASPRKMSAGTVAIGSCIRLMDWNGNGPLGIAEGIETAFAAANQFKMPVWSAINAQMLARWQWPEGCKSVMIFGDNDASFTGQAAAFELAKRAACKGLEVQVCIPGVIFTTGFNDTDYADMVNNQHKEREDEQE